MIIVKFFTFCCDLKDKKEHTNRGARGVMVIVTGYGHGDTSSIPGQD